MSPRTIYLSRLIGLFLLIVALPMLADKARAMALIATLIHDPSAIILVGMIGIAVGLALVLGHQVWSGGILPVVVTLLGWLFLLRSTILFWLSPATVVRFVEWVRFDELFYFYLGFVALLGLYLTVHGFSAARHARFAGGQA